MRNTRKRGRTIRLNKRLVPDAAKWVRWLEDKCLGSAGPRPDIRGMRKQFWGTSALIVQAGQYAYYMEREDDGKAMPWDK